MCRACAQELNVCNDERNKRGGWAVRPIQILRKHEAIVDRWILLPSEPCHQCSCGTSPPEEEAHKAQHDANLRHQSFVSQILIHVSLILSFVKEGKEWLVTRLRVDLLVS